MITICNKSNSAYKYYYRGEGNAHLALSLPEVNKIVLIKKFGSSNERQDEASWEDSINFHNKIMRLLLEPFVSVVAKLYISNKELQAIANNIATKRPEFRRNKLLSGSSSALMQDYTKLTSDNPLWEQLPTIACEIKPKCAIDLDNQCAFCLKQLEKLKTGRIQRITNYCPRKLYSGDIKLMKEAVKDLLENPQNNIQIYKNSQLIYSDKHDIHELHRHFLDWNSRDKISTFINVVAEILHVKHENKRVCAMCKESSTFTVLNRIKELQKLDSSKKPPIVTDRGYVRSLLSTIQESEVDSQWGRCKLILSCSSLSKHYLSKIARDCSIMISLKQIPDKCDTDVQFVCVDDVYYLYNIKVFDLFPKKEKLL